MAETITKTMDTANNAVSSVTQGVINPKACINWDTNMGKIALALVIIAIIYLVKRSKNKSGCPKPPQVRPCPPCNLNSLGYLGPVDVIGDHKLLSGQSKTRSWKNTCFDTLELTYSAPAPDAQDPSVDPGV